MAATALAPVATATAATAEAAPIPDATPTVVVSPDRDLAPSGATVTVDGSGFGTAVDGVYVRFCAEAAGESGTPEGRPDATRCLGESQRWVSNSPGSSAPMGLDGSFTVAIDVVSVFEGSEGAVFDCRRVACGIATRRDHVGGASDHGLDTFTPMSFATTGEEPTPPTGQPLAGPPAVADGGSLDWGVKRSFRTYVESGPADGAIEVREGAARNADGTFRFSPSAPAEHRSVRDLDASHAGTVRFIGHDGTLDLTITDPRISMDGNSGSLVVDGRSRDADTGLYEDFDDAVIARLDPSGVDPYRRDDLAVYEAVPAILTATGSEIFAGFYQEGEELDPLTIAVLTEDAASLPEHTDDEDAPAAVASERCLPPTVPAGARVTVCTSGFTPGEQVQVRLLPERRSLVVGVAASDGSFRSEITLGADARGRHRVELRGVSSGTVVTSADFDIDRPASELPRTGGVGGLLPAGLLSVAALCGLRLRRSGSAAR